MKPKRPAPPRLPDKEALDRIVDAFDAGLVSTGTRAATDLLEEVARLVRLSGRRVDDGTQP